MALDSKSVSFCVASCMNILRHMGVSSVAVLIAISVSLAPDRAHAYAPVPCPNRFLTMPDYPPAGGSAPAPTGNLTDGSASARHLIHANNLITPPQTWGTSMADSLQNITYSLAAGEIAGGVIASGVGKVVGAIRGGTATTTTGGRVFWSGGTTAREGAETFARSTGGQTLETTPIGRTLDAITTAKTYPYVKPLWNKASQNFARGAEGAVDVFHSSQGVRLESVWRTVEYPALTKTGNPINYQVTP